MSKRIGLILLCVCLLVGAVLGIGFGLHAGKDGPETSLEDMAADFTPEEEKRYASYLNIPSGNGLEVHFWLEAGQIVGTVRAVSVTEEAVPPEAELRADPIDVVTMRKILRHYPGVRVIVRSAEGLSAEQLNEAKGICVIP